MNIHTMTLKKQLTAHEMKEVKNYLYDTNTHGDTYQQSGVTICNRFASQGINIKLVPNFNPDDFGINLIIVTLNLHNVIEEKSRIKTFELTHENIEKLQISFLTALGDLPCLLNFIELYTVDRIDLCVDMKMDEKLIDQYIKFGNACYLPPHFKRNKWYDPTAKRTKKSSHRIELNSRSVNIVIYNKEKQLKCQNITDLDSKSAQNIIRSEVALNYPLLKDISTKYGNTEQENSPVFILGFLEQYGDRIFLDYFQHVFRKGQHLPLSDSIEIINQSSLKKKTKKLLIRILKTACTYGSLEKAIKLLKEEGIKQNKINSLMKTFDELNINPITIPVRKKRKWLPNICTHIENKLTGRIDRV